MVLNSPDRAVMHLPGEVFDGLKRLPYLLLNLRSGGKVGVAQPVMAHHAFLVGIGDDTALEFGHFRKCLLQSRLERIQVALREMHSAKVQSHSEFLHFGVVGFKPFPQFLFRKSHRMMSATYQTLQKAKPERQF